MNLDSLSAEQRDLVKMLESDIVLEGGANEWAVKYLVSGTLDEQTSQFTFEHDVVFHYLGNSPEVLGWVDFWVYGRHINLRGGQMCKVDQRRAWGSGSHTGNVFKILPMSIDELRPHVVVGWNGDLQLIRIEFSETGNA